MGMEPAKIDTTEIVESVITKGDLSKLTPSERVQYYLAICQSLNLNPLTKPFDYINLSGKLTLYATRTATDQLRKNNGISITITSRERLDDIYIVTARGTDATGRTDESVGAVNIAGLKGDALANALMKAETKAKRRVTLSLAGLGWIDETEIETVPGARLANVNAETGEIIDIPPTAQEEQQSPELIQPAKKPANGTDKATEAQLRAIHSIAKRKLSGLPTEEVEEWLHIFAKERFYIDSLKELTKQQASQFIEELQWMNN